MLPVRGVVPAKFSSSIGSGFNPCLEDDGTGPVETDVDEIGLSREAWTR